MEIVDRANFFPVAPARVSAVGDQARLRARGAERLISEKMRADASSMALLATAHSRVLPPTMDPTAMLKMPPPVDPTVTYVEGYYWIQNLKLGSLGVRLYKDGRWHQYEQRGEEIGIVEGPLQPPTEEQLVAQDAYFAAETQKMRASYGAVQDPSWFNWLDGYYWLQFDGEEPEVAFVMEDNWHSLTFDGSDFAPSDPADEDDAMPVLVGPLVEPKVERTLHS